jgi:hypothetical protein
MVMLGGLRFLRAVVLADFALFPTPISSPWFSPGNDLIQSVNTTRSPGRSDHHPKPISTGSAFAAAVMGERFGPTAAAGSLLILTGCVFSNLGMDGVKSFLFKGEEEKQLLE